MSKSLSTRFSVSLWYLGLIFNEGTAVVQVCLISVFSF